MNKKLILAGITLLTAATSFAGNPDRSGQAGAQQLLVNGWARSSGWGWANVAAVKGLESMYMNVAGLTKSSQTEVGMARTAWLSGSGINVNSFGFCQTLGENKESTFGVSITSFGVAPIQITTEDQPNGGLGTYKPTMTNIGIGYAKKFNEVISAGVLFRIVSEGIPDMRALGLAIDAGVQYTTTLRPTNKRKKNDLHFGISAKNIGPDMRYQGDGLAIKAVVNNGTFTKTLQNRPDKVNLPSLMNISGSYDMKLDNNPEMINRLTVAGTFTNNSFSNNQTSLGVEYGFKKILAFRAGFVYEKDLFNKELRKTALSGFCGGFTIELPMSKDGSTIALDYSYRSTNPFNGTHSFGLKINLDYNGSSGDDE